MKKMGAYRLYMVYEGVSALLMSMIFTASMIYQVTAVGLSPLQLVLVGTTLEAATLLLEVPTGVVADVTSRRLSVIIGVFLIGVGFLVEGSFPFFLTILLAQVIWALGYTFTSGASQAWISDEIGEEAAGVAFLRANQAGNLCALLGIGAGMWIGSLSINLPIQLGGAGMLLLGVFLAFKMPENGFKPADRQERNTWGKMRGTFLDGLGAVRRRPALLTILAIGLIYGLYSEGFDRLWTKQILDEFSLPLAGVVEPVVWLGLLRGVSLLAAIGATGIAERRVDTNSHGGVGRSLFLISGLLAVGMFSFALSGSLWLSLSAYFVIYVARNLISPLYTAWVNQRLDSSVRATVISMSGQVDALGQIAGGPLVGMIGSLVSVRAALLASSVILTPVLALYRLATTRGDLTEAAAERLVAIDP